MDYQKFYFDDLGEDEQLATVTEVSEYLMSVLETIRLNPKGLTDEEKLASIDSLASQCIEWLELRK